MSNWREAMNADILSFFEVEQPHAEVSGIEVITREVGGCWTCRWTEFYVQVTFSTSAGALIREYEGNMSAFFTAVWESAEKQREDEREEQEAAAGHGSDYGWEHRRSY